MSQSDVETTYIQEAIDRYQRGERAGCDELIRRVRGRLESMARQQLRSYPAVSRWEEAEDILQKALIRLVRALETERPASTQEFFRLASEQLRRELIDMVRHYTGPYGIGTNHISVSGSAADPPAPDDLADLERWASFHEAVEALPAEEREVISLRFYHRWTQEQIATELGVSVMTVRRRHLDACRILEEQLGEGYPQP